MVPDDGECDWEPDHRTECVDRVDRTGVLVVDPVVPVIPEHPLEVRGVFSQVVPEAGTPGILVAAERVGEPGCQVADGGEVVVQGPSDFIVNDPKAREIYLGPEFNL